MNMKQLEDTLRQMTKPQVSQLKHEDLLAHEISKAKERSIVSLWWLSIPLYLIAMLLMKAIFNTQGNFFVYLYDTALSQKYMVIGLFYVLPGLLILINSLSIWKVYKTLGRPGSLGYLKSVWLNLLIILLALGLIIIILS